MCGYVGPCIRNKAFCTVNLRKSTIQYSKFNEQQNVCKKFRVLSFIRLEGVDVYFIKQDSLCDIKLNIFFTFM
jgi:hypothetical protein